MCTIAKIFVIALLSVGAGAWAANIHVEPSTKSDPALISIVGSIAEGDDAKFRQVAAGQANAIVVLESDGGAIIPAMDIGRTIRLLEYSTVVYQDSSCTSACALIWLAGTRRFIFEGGKVGFHASYRNVDGSLIETGLGNALIGHYLSQLGMGQKTVIFATAAAPDKILWLDAKTASLSAIEYETIPSDKGPNLQGKTAEGQPTLEPIAIAPQPDHRLRQGGEGDRTSSDAKSWVAATNETVRNVDAFARALQRNGYQAEIDQSDKANPRIITGVGGSRVAIVFSSCTAFDCNYAEILSSWNDVDPLSAQKALGSWVKDENFAAAIYLDKSRSLALYHYIILGQDGITVKNMIENIEYFSREYDAIGKVLVDASRVSAINPTGINGLAALIASQVKPCYVLPQGGADTTSIISFIRLHLKKDGSIAVAPEVTGNSGVTPTNQYYVQQMNQAATRALERCAPYRLPAELYKGGWEDLSFTFHPSQMN